MTQTTTTMSNRMTFEEFRQFMWETDKGKVVDSLISIEVGLEAYMTWWEAHLDFYETLGETHEEHDVILDFLMGTAELLDMADIADDIDKVLGAAHE